MDQYELTRFIGERSERLPNVPVQAVGPAPGTGPVIATGPVEALRSVIGPTPVFAVGVRLVEAHRCSRGSGCFLSALLLLVSFGQLHGLLKRQGRCFTSCIFVVEYFHLSPGMTILNGHLLFVDCFHSSVYALVG